MQESESVESLSTTTTTTSRQALVNHHHEQAFSLGLDEGLPDGSDTIPSSSYSYSSAKEGRGGGGGGSGRLASSSSTGSLIAGCLFSPSNTTANTSGASTSSFLFNRYIHHLTFFTCDCMRLTSRASICCYTIPTHTLTPGGWLSNDRFTPFFSLPLSLSLSPAAS